MMSVRHRGRTPGFTIVELLIVIVVIALLAAITVVAFNGVQQRARASAVSSSLATSKKKLELYKAENGTYPLTGNLTAAGVNDGDTSFQYTSNGTTFCVTGTNGTISYRVTETTGPTSGGCAGHGQGGVAAIKNLALDPRASGSSWLSPIVPNVTRSMNVSWNGKTNWSRFVWNGTGFTTVRMMLNLSDLTNGQSYTTSFLAGNDGASPVTFSMDLADVTPVPVFTLAPGEQTRVSFTASRATYDSTFRFIDMNLQTSGGNGVLMTDAMVTQGSSSYSFAHGDSPDWAWTGAVNNSTSTGPPL